MGTKMTLSARAELTNAVRRRYSAATGAEKRKILDEFIAVTGYHEKSAIRALNTEPTVSKRQTRVRPSLYDEAVRAALIVLWEASDRVCGKRLRALLPILLPALERNGHLHLADPMRQKILAMSASTHRPIAARAAQRHTPEEGPPRDACGATACAGAHLRGLERAAAGKHGDRLCRALRGCQPRQLRQQFGPDRHRERLDGSGAAGGSRERSAR
jgi:hypothetical protein